MNFRFFPILEVASLVLGLSLFCNYKGLAQSSNVPLLAEQQAYERTVAPIDDSARDIYNRLKYGIQVKTSGYDTNRLQVEYTRLEIARKKLTIDFIKTRPSSYFALTIFDRWVMSRPLTNDSLSVLFDGFDAGVRDTELGKKILNELDIRKSLGIGRKMPDFQFFTDSLKSHHLSELRRSGPVLIGFWAAGCKPYITHIPFMRVIAKKYKNRGLQILWVCTGSPEDWWKKRLQAIDMPWLHTFDSDTYRGKAPLDSLYNIKYYPQYFLIDKEGTLLYHNIQSQDDEEHTVLTEVLRKSLQ